VGTAPVYTLEELRDPENRELLHRLLDQFIERVAPTRLGDQDPFTLTFDVLPEDEIEDPTKRVFLQHPDNGH
jgi:hypothetical protein